jgi:hypothetical protein
LRLGAASNQTATLASSRPRTPSGEPQGTAEVDVAGRGGKLFSNKDGVLVCLHDATVDRRPRTRPGKSQGTAGRFRRLLPDARHIGLVPEPGDIEAFAAAGVKVMRLWPKWLADETLVPRVRKLGLELHPGTGGGTRDEVLPLLAPGPESLSSDDPARLIRTLAAIAGKK